MKTEMKQRATQRGLTKPQKNLAPPAECVQWLNANSIRNKEDIAHLLLEEAKVYEMLPAMQKQENEEAERQKLQGANWTGNKPWIRFYHCLSWDNTLVGCLLCQRV